MSPQLFLILFFVGLLSPAVAIICAALFYARHRRGRPNPERRFPIVAYVLILLASAVIGYVFALWFGIYLACVRYPSGNLCGLFGFFTAGPLGAALAVLLVGSLILFLPADAQLLPVAAEPVRAGDRWRLSSAYLKLWRGEYSLASSFWGFFVLGTYIVRIVFLVPLAFGPVLALGYDLIAAVGVWRSANAFKMRAEGGSPVPADSAKIIAAKIVVVLWLLCSICTLALLTLGRWHLKN
jgi:hypothetical protein